MRAFLSSAFAAGLIATSASAYTAINGLTVNPVQGGFEVTSQGGDGPRQIWCAAGQYARVAEGAGNNARVYVLRPYGASQTRPGYRAVQFTTRPTAALAQGARPGSGGNYSVSIRDAGFNLSTAHAEGFCTDVFDRFNDRWPFN